MIIFIPAASKLKLFEKTLASAKPTKTTAMTVNKINNLIRFYYEL